ncbi:hypothetical protein D3C71_2024060 [compost metagenome]
MKKCGHLQQSSTSLLDQTLVSPFSNVLAAGRDRASGRACEEIDAGPLRVDRAVEACVVLLAVGWAVLEHS